MQTPRHTDSADRPANIGPDWLRLCTLPARTPRRGLSLRYRRLISLPNRTIIGHTNVVGYYFLGAFFRLWFWCFLADSSRKQWHRRKRSVKWRHMYCAEKCPADWRLVTRTLNNKPVRGFMCCIYWNAKLVHTCVIYIIISFFLWNIHICQFLGASLPLLLREVGTWISAHLTFDSNWPSWHLNHFQVRSGHWLTYDVISKYLHRQRMSQLRNAANICKPFWARCSSKRYALTSGYL